MKVYESSHQTKRDYKKVPQIKIKNEELRKSGFDIGKRFKVIYLNNKLILEILTTQSD